MYELQAVIARDEVLRAVARGLAAAATAPVGQGFSLMPMTRELFDGVTDGSAAEPLGFWRLPAGFDGTLARWSTTGAVAYVESEYFGGVGEERAAVWDGGALVLGPLHLPEGQAFPRDGGPVSQALRRLGVVAGATEDEFTAVGLDRHRCGEDWIAAGRG
ncbi:hypothetical protein OIB37_30550 [Streptomyces sp. NBC_00820]|uniref:hypothetical protein n=1 Tax=Streptomyces sp. NBC_00820 TaxID=2975842 RepID=UPI002ED1F67E|nr:hypothetical protein OIB37_30550 [Streptomyces sp. NBC_00820]